jgi:hypothetical protein
MMPSNSTTIGCAEAARAETASTTAATNATAATVDVNESAAGRDE